MSRYGAALGKLSFSDIISSVDWSFIKGDIPAVHKHYGCNSRKNLALKVARDCLKMILESAVEEGNIVKLPSRTKSYICVNEESEAFTRVKNNKNLLQAIMDDYKQFNMFLYTRTQNKRFKRTRIILNSEYYERIKNNKDLYIENVYVFLKKYA